MAHERQRTSLWDIVKNVFFFLIILQIAPSLFEGIRKQYSKYIFVKTQVGVIPIRGILYDSTTITKDLTKFFKNPDIKAIVLKIECPGGAAGSSQALFTELQALKKQHPKPVITLVENVCASGGYYVACGSDYIIAAGTATVGSIGVYLPSLQLKEFIEQFKIHYTSITSGAYKTSTDPFTDKTEAQKELLQGISNDTYQQFVEDVARLRKLPTANMQEWADGKIFTARQALKIGLIDELGSASTAQRVVREKALIEGEIEWIYPVKPTGLAALFGSQSSDDEENSLVSTCMDTACSFVEQRYFKPTMY